MNSNQEIPFLYFAPFGANGHHPLYAKALLRAAQESDTPLIIAGGTCLIDEIYNGSTGSVQLHRLEDGVVRRCRTSFLALRGLMQLREGERVARETGANLVFQSYIDHALIAVAAGLARMPVSGIWFRFPSLPVSRWSLSRLIMYRKAFASKSLQSAYVLDEAAAGALASESWTRGKVRYLPEAVDESVALVPLEIQALVARTKAEGRRLYGIVGSLDERKGIENVLRALQNLPGDVACRVSLLLAGEFYSEEYQSRCSSAIRRLENLRPDINVIALNRRLTDQEFAGVIDACDAMLIIYTEHHLGSSGVLTQAVVRGRPVIGSDHEIVGDLIQRYELGKTVKGSCVNSILSCIIQDVASPFSLSANSRRRFLNNIHRTGFGLSILASTRD